MNILTPYNCPLCKGDGFIVTDYTDHHPFCDGFETCNELCPISEQEQEACAACNGVGKVDYNTLVELVTTIMDYLSPMEQAVLIDATLRHADRQLAPVTVNPDDTVPF